MIDTLSHEKGYWEIFQKLFEVEFKSRHQVWEGIEAQES